jgi:hypothetical protein
MIIANFTQIPTNSSVVEYAFAFNNAMGGYAVISVLLALLVVMIMGFYYWNQDFVFCAKNSLYLITFSAFVLTLIKSEIYLEPSGDPQRLFNFAGFSFFLILLVLLVYYEQVSE